MIYPSIDKILTGEFKSKYELVIATSKRAKEINDTEFLQMKSNEYKCVSSVGKALEEIEKDLVKYEK